MKTINVIFSCEYPMLGWMSTRCHTNHMAAYISLDEARQDPQVVPNIEIEYGDSVAIKIKKIVQTKVQGKQTHVPTNFWREVAQVNGRSQKHPHPIEIYVLSKLLYGDTPRRSADISTCFDVPVHAEY